MARRCWYAFVLHVDTLVPRCLARASWLLHTEFLVEVLYCIMVYYPMLFTLAYNPKTRSSLSFTRCKTLYNMSAFSYFNRDVNSSHVLLSTNCCISRIILIYSVTFWKQNCLRHHLAHTMVHKACPAWRVQENVSDHNYSTNARSSNFRWQRSRILVISVEWDELMKLIECFRPLSTIKTAFDQCAYPQFIKTYITPSSVNFKS